MGRKKRKSFLVKYQENGLTKKERKQKKKKGYLKIRRYHNWPRQNSYLIGAKLQLDAVVELGLFCSEVMCGWLMDETTDEGNGAVLPPLPLTEI